MSATAAVFIAPERLTTASLPPSAANLLGAVRKGSPVSVAISAAAASAYSGWLFRPVPTAVPPSASSYIAGSAAFTAAIAPCTCAA